MSGFHPEGGPREEPPVVHDDAVVDEARAARGAPFALLSKLKQEHGGILTGPAMILVMEALEERLIRLEEHVGDLEAPEPRPTF